MFHCWNSKEIVVFHNMNSFILTVEINSSKRWNEFIHPNGGMNSFIQTVEWIRSSNGGMNSYIQTVEWIHSFKRWYEFIQTVENRKTTKYTEMIKEQFFIRTTTLTWEDGQKKYENIM